MPEILHTRLTKKVSVTAIILAAGQGTRMKLGYNKLFHKLAGRPILCRSIEKFEENPDITEIVIVANKDDMQIVYGYIKKYNYQKVTAVVPGGQTRQESSLLGVGSVKDAGLIVVHDGARPLVRPAVIKRAIQDARRYGASIVGVPVKDTIKVSKKNDLVQATPDRSKLWIIQTPQVFKAKIIRDAHRQAGKDGFSGTDESSLVERTGHRVRITKGDYDNIKITTPDDLILAAQIIKQQNDD